MNAPAPRHPRSLSGQKLEGTKLVRLIYMDEAGISKNERFLTVGAVAVHADEQLIGVEQRLDQLVEQWIPKSQRDGFVFHAKEIFNGGGVFQRDQWPLDKRLRIAVDLAHIPVAHDLKLGLAVADKSQSYPADFQEKWDAAKEADRAVFLHASTFSACVMGIENWMRQSVPDEVCLLISEDNDQARQTIKEVIRFQQSGAAKYSVNDKYKKYFPLRKVREDPAFQPKRSSSVLQIADFWAYVAKRHHMQDPKASELWEIMEPSLVPPIFDQEQLA